MKNLHVFVFAALLFPVFASCGSSNPSFPMNHIAIRGGNGAQLTNPVTLIKGTYFTFEAVFYNAKNEVMTVPHPENITWTTGSNTWFITPSSGTYTVRLSVPTSDPTATSFIQVEYENLPITSLKLDIKDP